MIKMLIDKIKRQRDPVKYWRKKGVAIGENCAILSGVSFGSEPYLITLGNHVRVSSNTLFVTHDGGLWVLREMYKELSNADKFGQIVVGDNVNIGVNCIIMPGVTIGNNCIVGAGAIVTKDVPDNSIVVGIPARVIENIDEYKNKNMKKFDYTKHMSPSEKQSYLMAKYQIDSTQGE